MNAHDTQTDRTAELRARRAATVDVALLLEGTYPFVAGGVSSWIHQLLTGCPELRFGIVFLGSQPQDYAGPRYAVPANVVHFEDHYLYERTESPPVKPRSGDASTFEKVAELHEYFRAPADNAGAATLMEELSDELQGRLSLEDFLYSERSWEYIRDQFSRHSRDPSFVDYFWTVRIMHAPIWRLARIAAGLPSARLFHTVSTGYAGLLGVLCKRRHRRPLIVSEHGIYTKERKIDLFGAEWIRDNRSLFDRDTLQISYLRQMWIKFFEALGRAAYDSADRIVALYEANRQRQIADGAAPEKTCVIANGIPVARFAEGRAVRPGTPPPVVCLVGRVVPIKDVKTFIQAMRVVTQRLPEAEGWIAGPLEEDPLYAEECRGLIRALGLEARVRLLGMQDIAALLPQVGILALSSISEALPLSVLEAFAAGVPAICTDVGSCRQLIHGGEPGDQALGPAGRIVGIADAQSLADAVLELLADIDGWHAAAAAGMARVDQFYSEALMLERYRALYADVGGKGAEGGGVAGGPAGAPSPTRGR